MNYPDVNPTWGIRWRLGYFEAHLMWMHCPSGEWRSSRKMIRRRYQTLEGALLAFNEAGVVMIFPV